jgi:hypothetical protein
MELTEATARLISYVVSLEDGPVKIELQEVAETVIAQLANLIIKDSEVFNEVFIRRTKRG